MRILLLHNKYQYAGGEDKVFESEAELLSSHDHLVERLTFDNKEIKTFFDKIRSGVLGIYNFRSAKIVDRKIKEFKPDIMHVHNFVPLASPSVFFAAKRNNVPVVLTLHNYRLICPSATLYHNNKIYERSLRSLFPFDAIIKGVYRDSVAQTAALALMTSIHNIAATWRNKVSKFIVLTEFARSKFIESRLNVSPQQLMLKPNFIADPGTGLDVREDFFLYVGRLTEEKGIRTLLNAVQDSDLKLVIIGDGPLQKEVEVAASKAKHIDYLGFQSKAAIMDRMKRAAALIVPSTWYEGFPVTILEAFATGTPVIGSRLGGIAEIVSDKVNGVLFEPGNETVLRETLQAFRKSDNRSLSQNARKAYSELYTPDKNYSILMDIYREALNRN